MLTCKLGENTINCYDGTYNRDQFKKWSRKKILLCPVCGKPYEYCHGNVKMPYFRHKDKKVCEDKYSESETEEHMMGKRDLFEWIKSQPGVTDAELEAWIPETKQRPDIMFKYRGEKCVIEYQCTPIASEYDERHELYQAAEIRDIWILGYEKYIGGTKREKYINKYAEGFYNAKNKMFAPLKYNNLYLKMYKKEYEYTYGYSTNNTYFLFMPLNEFVFNNGFENIYFGDINTARNKIIERAKKLDLYELYKKYGHQQKIDALGKQIEIINNKKIEGGWWSFVVEDWIPRYKYSRRRGWHIDHYANNGIYYIKIQYVPGKSSKTSENFRRYCYDYFKDFDTNKIDDYDKIRSIVNLDYFMKNHIMPFIKINAKIASNFKDSIIV